MPESEKDPQAPLPASLRMQAASFRAPLTGAGNTMRTAWALSREGEEEEPVEGTVISGQGLAVRVASTPLPGVPKKEPAPQPSAASPTPAEPESPKPAQTKKLHDFLAMGKAHGLASLANDRMEKPAIKAWADEPIRSDSP